METSAGHVEVTWGINRWVLLETAAGSFQQQVSRPPQRVALLTEAGLSPARDRAAVVGG